MKRLISIGMLALLVCSVGFAQDEAAKKKAAEASRRIVAGAGR